MRYCGKVGFLNSTETSPGVWTDEPVERIYRGDVIRNQKQYALGEGMIDNIQLNNSFSIIADPFIRENYLHIVYVTYMGNKWKVLNADIRDRRIILTVGGEYK